MSDEPLKVRDAERVDDAIFTNSDRKREVGQMPDEKLAMLYACAVVSKVQCANCDSVTWLIGSAGRNGTDTCHHCDQEYKVVG